MKNKDIEKLYQKSKTEKSPASLDNFILAQAKNSCDEKPLASHSSTKKRWLFSLSTAAVVMLSFSIILNLQHENSIVTEPAEYMQKSIQKQSAPMKKKAERKENSPSVSSGFSERSINFESMEDKDTAEIPPAYQETDKITDVKESIDEAPYSVPVSPIIVIKPDEIKPTPETEQLEAVSDEIVVENEDITPVSENINTDLSSNDADNNQIEEVEETIVQTPEISQPVKNETLKSDDINSSEEPEKLGKIIATGSRIRAAKDNQPMASEALNTQSTRTNQDLNYSEELDAITVLDDELSFTQQLEKLDALINSEQLSEAKKLLEELQETYSYYDFSKYKKLLD